MLHLRSSTGKSDSGKKFLSVRWVLLPSSSRYHLKYSESNLESLGSRLEHTVATQKINLEINFC